LIDDDEALLRALRIGLSARGYEVELARSGAEGVTQSSLAQPDVIVLDLGLPDMDGVDVCRRVRQFSAVPIIVLSAAATEERKVAALDLGADDYITKPFATRELVARVKAVLRRFERPTTPSVLKFEAIEIDASAMQLRVNGELVTTTATEFRLLDYLARHPGRVFSRDHLLDAVWGDARFVTPRSVDVYVRRIREKIEEDAETPRYLKTMRGAGYRFEIPKVVA